MKSWGLVTGGLLIGLTVGFAALQGPWLLRVMNHTARIQQQSELQDNQCRAALAEVSARLGAVEIRKIKAKGTR